MTITSESSDKLAKRLAEIPQAILEALRPALLRSGKDVADDARALAESSRRTGDLIDSIVVTGPGETTPAYASDGGRRTAHAAQVLVTVGGPKQRHGHLVEFGTDERQHADGTSTGKMAAEPFLLPSWRLNQARVERRLNRAIAKAIREGSK